MNKNDIVYVYNLYASSHFAFTVALKTKSRRDVPDARRFAPVDTREPIHYSDETNR